MASGARKWLVGCGIGCGFMILAAGGVGTCGYLGVKKIKDRADRMDTGWEALEAEYGHPGAYVPPADGVVTAERIEAFLAVRDAMAPARDSLARTLTSLDEDGKSVSGVFGKMRAGLSLVPSLLDFVDERNRALLEQGMGLGEYLSIYSTVYYAWLGKDPADGPSFALNDNKGGTGDDDDVHFKWSGEIGDKDPERVRRRREADIRRYVHKMEAPMLANQLAAARAAGLDPAWIGRLEAESAAMAADPERVLWQDDLPASIADAFAPYRDRLEGAYVPVMNAVEVGLVEHD